jgi:hypothetical protein
VRIAQFVDYCVPVRVTNTSSGWKGKKVPACKQANLLLMHAVQDLQTRHDRAISAIKAGQRSFTVC